MSSAPQRVGPAPETALSIDEWMMLFRWQPSLKEDIGEQALRHLCDFFAMDGLLIQKAGRKARVVSIHPLSRRAGWSDLLWSPLFQRVVEQPDKGAFEIGRARMPDDLRARGVRDYVLIPLPWPKDRVLMLYNRKSERILTRSHYYLVRSFLMMQTGHQLSLIAPGAAMPGSAQECRALSPSAPEWYRVFVQGALLTPETVTDLVLDAMRATSERARRESIEIVLEANFGRGWRTELPESLDHLRQDWDDRKRAVIARACIVCRKPEIAERILGVRREA